MKPSFLYFQEVGRFLPFISSTLFAYSDSDAKVGKKVGYNYFHCIFNKFYPTLMLYTMWHWKAVGDLGIC